jgi:hypothetical protein
VTKKQSAETKYRYLRRDARIMADMLDVAAQRLDQIARRHDSSDVLATSINLTFKYTASDVRELASECTRIAYQCGRGRGRKTR